MTTTNGQGRIVEHVEGVIAGANERGVHLQGETDWRNWSKWAESRTQPARGQRVRLALDGSGFVRELQVLEAAAAPSSPNRDREIRRMACLKAAAHFLGLMSQAREEIRSDHVLVLADKWVRWVEQEGGEQ